MVFPFSVASNLPSPLQVGRPLAVLTTVDMTPPGSLFARNATKEVILAAGAVNTPQLLMLSGIGDSAQLSKFNIRTIVNIPDVGKNMQDHVVLLNVFSVNSNFTYDNIGRNTTLFQNDLAQWEQSHTGPFATSVTSEIGWLRLPKNSTIFKTAGDPSSGPQAPHYEFFFIVSLAGSLPRGMSLSFRPQNGFASTVGGGSPPTTGHFMTIASNLMTPTSRESCSLITALLLINAKWRRRIDHPCFCKPLRPT